MAMGAEPLFFLDYFATSRIDPQVFARVVGAMADACAAHGCTLLGGETAEMPGMYGPDSYDLAGFLVGAVARDAVLGPRRVLEGDACVGVPSNGLHTNGYTLARAILARTASAQGKEIGDVLAAPRADLEGASLGDALLRPHRSYLADFRAIRDVARIRSIAHLTGGGWEGNLPRALPDGLGARIDRSAWRTPALFGVLAEIGGVPEDDQWDTWNMGIGLVVIVAREDASAALRAVPGAVLLGHVERAHGERRVRFA
jgi:phosphoribosylformylglycinamidine cyclo-ligase